MSGNWASLPEGAKPYLIQKDGLSIDADCLLWESWLIIWPKLRGKIISELHNAHPGIVTMKATARAHVWWTGLDSGIESSASHCYTCQAHAKTLPQSPLAMWSGPSKPWTRQHIDHASQFQEKLFLIVVDAHSKWIEALVVPSSSSAVTIEALRTMFAQHGIPNSIVSDNGSSFTSSEFQNLCKMNDIKHDTSALDKPASNGQAERAVQIIKNGLSCIKAPFNLV